MEENLNLDYKASPALNKQNNKTTEISKDVSSFANSDGGIIIYGIKENNKNKHIPEKIDPIKRNEFPKEWLEQIIQDKIRPRISDFKIYPIDIDLDNVVYVVEIRKSNTAHQAYDKRYYKRFNFQSTPMYDYEIKDIMNRNKNPEINLEFEIINKHRELVVFAKNTGSVYAKFINVLIWLPKKIVKGKFYKKLRNDIVEIYADNTIRDVLDVQIDGFNVNEKLGPSRYEPLLPSQRIKLTTIKLENYPFDYENIMKWEIFCDNSQPIKNEIRLNELLNKR